MADGDPMRPRVMLDESITAEDGLAFAGLAFVLLLLLDDGGAAGGGGGMAGGGGGGLLGLSLLPRGVALFKWSSSTSIGSTSSLHLPASSAAASAASLLAAAVPVWLPSCGRCFFLLGVSAFEPFELPPPPFFFLLERFLPMV